MKTLTKSISLFSAILATTALSASAAEIAFDVDGINSNNGKIMIALYKGEAAYKNRKPTKHDAIAAQKGSITVTFKDLPQGEYVIQVFHDEDNNGALGRNMVGMPTEGYGFSNNAQPNFGPASYDDMKFSIADASAVVKNGTTMIY